ncbi:fumarylacetoacetate hydrolase family protein [Leucobacter sp. M11]|uniref:fumarylacetoacetate hydrolase family protein n=1 Tax=Leucobacter sp. M11 TaxID=2993565 RepID=UPI002D8073D3|nr:fumarylacetoacetate hydrolase family protein [Leucobacter sp. M11]MEB4614246.1 fumarylacetoacetate hydrolase family protein [Leucobacter sp. M11]
MTAVEHRIRVNWPPSAAETLPEDADRAVLVGRAWSPHHDGPSVVTVRNGRLVDVTASFPTVSQVTESPDPATVLRGAYGEDLGSLGEALANTDPEVRDPAHPWLLSPLDLHAVKAAGVTFPVSMLERLIEERAGGEPTAAAEMRLTITEALGGSLAELVPGSEAATRLKERLRERGLWSQYLEVGIGADAEIFTKAQPLSSVGTAGQAGVLSTSDWNNPEPELGVIVSSSGAIVGATLGNDVNLRDVEGRSALLLSKAKDNNAAAVIGPFLRLFDEEFTLDDVRAATVQLDVMGEDGFLLGGSSSQRESSRDPADLVGQLLGDHHQYPDGAVLLLGTLFAPVTDRGASGQGFTHHRRDLVRIATPRLGALVSRVEHSERCEPWTMGISDLFARLNRRGVLGG